MSGRKIYGIDLGTTASCIAHVDEHGKPVVLPNAEDEMTTPSVVFFESPDHVVVGQAAKAVASIHSDLCVSTVKRAMGDPHWERSFHGQAYKPQDISSFILRKVVEDAEDLVGEKIEDVVITCPAFFGINEKEATKQAGFLAGLNVLYVIPEPTAAALAYGIEQEQDQVIMVYDLGGGTFDITLIEFKSGQMTVICTGGDHQLGGKDWDDAIVHNFTQKFEESTNIPADNLLDDQETYQELLNAAERCKKALSTRLSVTEILRFGGERVKVDLTRDTFDQITAGLLERTLGLTEQEVTRANEKGYTKIDKLLLVGGSTYMPQVIEAVKRRFPFEIRQFDPNQAVAKGAALFGYKCYLDEQIKIRIAERTGQVPEQIEIEDVGATVVDKAQGEVARAHGLALPGLKAMVEKKITNVTSKSFGIVALNPDGREVAYNLILMDDRVPVSLTERFYTHEEGQISVDMRCVENRSQDRQAELSVSRDIGHAVLEFGRALPQGTVIEVTFHLGPDGLLSLHAWEQTTKREIKADLKTDSIMSCEEVEAARLRNLLLSVVAKRHNLTLGFGQLSRTSRRPPRDAEARDITERQKPPRKREHVFISYSHKDKVWLERLQVMLTPLVRKGAISLWDDTKITPGKPWKQEIENALASAQVAILLVSKDFLASDFVTQYELPSLLQAAEKEGLVILWLCLGHCLYRETEIHRFQAVHDPSRPLSSRGRAQWEKVLVDLGQRIKEAIQSAPSAS